MESKHIAWMISAIAFSIAMAMAVASFAPTTEPQLTDPVAQRIWAATHGNATLDDNQAVKLIRASTLADTIKKEDK